MPAKVKPLTTPKPGTSDAQLFELQSATLAEMPAGSSVAVVTLLGSLCPVTLAHIRTFEEARKIFLDAASPHRPPGLESFAAVLGFVSVNGDGYVSRKMAKTGVPALDAETRLALIRLAVADMPWMGTEPREGQSLWKLQQRWPSLNFVHFKMNGADDVAKHRKYAWADSLNRFLTMGRPGETEKVLAGMRRDGYEANAYHILGPELPDISSTEARRAIVAGDAAACARMLHPRVAEWCLSESAWRKKQ